MIELRRKIGLAVAHPIWGPVVTIALAVLLGLVFLHVVADDAGFAADVGAICVGVVTMLAAICVAGSGSTRRGSASDSWRSADHHVLPGACRQR